MPEELFKLNNFRIRFMPKPKKAKAKLPPYVILKHGGQWHVRITFPTKQRDSKGRIIYEQMSRRCEPKTAERATEIVAFLKQQNSEYKIEIERILTVNEFLERFLEAKRHNVSRRTYEFYAYLYKHHLKKTAFASSRLPDVDTMAVQTLYSILGTNKTSAAWIKKIHTFLSMAFKQAMFWDLIIKNPTAGVIVPRSKRRESPAFTRGEARAFIEACQTDDKYIIFEFALETGLRPQECLALRWSDIDFMHRKISVKQAVIEGYNNIGIEIGETKTDASRRTIGFSEKLKERLLHQKRIQAEMFSSANNGAKRSVLLSHIKAKGTNYQRRKTSKRISSETLTALRHYNLVFPSANGKPRSRQNLNNREMKEVLKLAGIDPKRFAFKHLRHSCATFLAEKLHPKKLQYHMGHSELSTTLKYYVHINDDSQFEASEIIGEFLY